MRGLLLLPLWCEEILSKNKTWEIRSRNTNIRETINIIASGTGTIVGECEIIDSFPLTRELFDNNYDKHHISCTFDELPANYRYVWALRNAKKYNEPIPYKHPRGAQIWVNLNN